MVVTSSFDALIRATRQREGGLTGMAHRITGSWAQEPSEPIVLKPDGLWFQGELGLEVSNEACWWLLPAFMAGVREIRMEEDIHGEDMVRLAQELGMLELGGAALERVQSEWAARVAHIQHNGQAGYEARDPFRRIVHDALTVSPDLTRAALHPSIVEVVRRYVGADAALTEAKGWRTMPTELDFHGWHNDAWYDPDLDHVPRQLKLAVYLSDVTSGAFAYAPGTHGQRAHRHYSEAEVDAFFNVALNDKGAKRGGFPIVRVASV